MPVKLIGNTFQTITWDEQTEVLEHLDKARKIIIKSKCSNFQQAQLLDKFNSLFHDIQVTNTKEL